MFYFLVILQTQIAYKNTKYLNYNKLAFSDVLGNRFNLKNYKCIYS